MPDAMCQSYHHNKHYAAKSHKSRRIISSLWGNVTPVGHRDLLLSLLGLLRAGTYDLLVSLLGLLRASTYDLLLSLLGPFRDSKPYVLLCRPSEG